MNAAFKPSLPELKCMILNATRTGERGTPVTFTFEALELENIGEDVPDGACWSANIVTRSAKGKKKSSRVLVSKKYHMGEVSSEFTCEGIGSARIWYDARILTNDEVVRSMLVTDMLKKAEEHLAKSQSHVASLKGLLRANHAASRTPSGV